MKKYVKPELEISKLTADVITASDPTIIDRGYEIIDGKLTGKVVSPLVMTGYVPDLLGSVSMLSADRKTDGAGYCGKGHKEWVKTAQGGPYLKAKVRLG